MTSHDNAVIISEADNLTSSSVELITSDEIEQDEVAQQHPGTDNSGLRYTTIPLEILEAAGVDLENPGILTDEQINTIVSLIQSGDGETHSELKHERDDIQQSSYENSMPSSSSDTGDRLTLYILDDGSLKLSDAVLQKEFFFTPEELALHNIDIDNLTNESLQRIIQMAMGSDDVVATKRRRLDDVIYAQFEGSSFLSNTSLEPAASTVFKRPLLNEEYSVQSQQSLIGSEVEIKRNGEIYSATIKYCRQSGGYKVQFNDGHFEWVSEDDIRLLNDGNSGKCGDHRSYGETTGTAPFDDINGSTISKKINGRKCIPNIPGIKVTATNGCRERKEPNFCCVVCDQKVYQKEPQYIVIRIPACDRCAAQKMILLDGTTKDCEVQTCTNRKTDLTASSANDE